MTVFNWFLVIIIAIIGLIIGVGNAYGIRSGILSYIPIPRAPEGTVNKNGLQVIGLSKWSVASTTNCAEAIIDSRCTGFEFSYCPFFNPDSPFRNANILNSIPTISITETIFLGWRNESAMQGDWSVTIEVIKDRANTVNTHINEIRGRVTKIVLIPVLEDYWREDQWLQAVAVISSQLDSGDKVYFRRSHMLNTDIPPEIITARLKNGENYSFVNTYLEAHKIDFGGDAKTISNDGGFVYQAVPVLGMYEDAGSISGMPGGYATTDNWFSSAKKSSKTAMLWRPAYNLFPRNIQNSRISYALPGVTLDKRFDNGADPFFNTFEAEIVKQFLSP